MKTLEIIAAIASITSSILSMIVLNKVNVIKKKIQNNSNNTVTQENIKSIGNVVGRDYKSK